jgi:hypothetical protein
MVKRALITSVLGVLVAAASSAQSWTAWQTLYQEGNSVVEISFDIGCRDQAYINSHYRWRSNFSGRQGSLWVQFDTDGCDGKTYHHSFTIILDKPHVEDNTWATWFAQSSRYHNLTAKFNDYGSGNSSSNGGSNQSSNNVPTSTSFTDWKTGSDGGKLKYRSRTVRRQNEYIPVIQFQNNTSCAVTIKYKLVGTPASIVIEGFDSEPEITIEANGTSPEISWPQAFLANTSFHAEVLSARYDPACNQNNSNNQSNPNYQFDQRATEVNNVKANNLSAAENNSNNEQTEQERQAELQRQKEEEERRKREEFQQLVDKNNADQEARDEKMATEVAEEMATMGALGIFVYKNIGAEYERPKNRFSKGSYRFNFTFGYSVTVIPVYENATYTTSTVSGSNSGEYTSDNFNFTPNLDIGLNFWPYYGKIWGIGFGGSAQGGMLPSSGGSMGIYSYDVGGKAMLGFPNFKIAAAYQAGDRGFSSSRERSSGDSNAGVADNGIYTGEGATYFRRMMIGPRITFNVNETLGNLEIMYYSETYPNLKRITSGGFYIGYEAHHRIKIYTEFSTNTARIGTIRYDIISSETKNTGFYMRFGFVRTMDWFGQPKS